MANRSRIAARSSFSQQRARLFFSLDPNFDQPSDGSGPLRSLRPMRDTRRDIVRLGLIGFIPGSSAT